MKNRPTSSVPYICTNLVDNEGMPPTPAQYMRVRDEVLRYIDSASGEEDKQLAWQIEIHIIGNISIKRIDHVS